MIGKKIYCLFRDSYGNPNGGLHYCEVLDKVLVLPKIIQRNERLDHLTAETHYIVKTIDPSPEIRSETFEWPARIELVYCKDISLDLKHSQ